MSLHALSTTSLAAAYVCFAPPIAIILLSAFYFLFRNKFRRALAAPLHELLMLYMIPWAAFVAGIIGNLNIDINSRIIVGTPILFILTYALTNPFYQLEVVYARPGDFSQPAWERALAELRDAEKIDAKRKREIRYYLRRLELAADSTLARAQGMRFLGYLRSSSRQAVRMASLVLVFVVVDIGVSVALGKMLYLASTPLAVASWIVKIWTDFCVVRSRASYDGMSQRKAAQLIFVLLEQVPSVRQPRIRILDNENYFLRRRARGNVISKSAKSEVPVEECRRKRLMRALLESPDSKVRVV